MSTGHISVGALRVIVLGYVIRGPLGGLAWHHLQYVLGLAKLGHDVYFLEDSGDYPSCYDPNRHVTDTDPGYGLLFAAKVFARMGLSDRWAYYDAHQQQWNGPAAQRSRQLCATADVLLNLSGVTPLRDWLLDVPIRVFVDTDPVFTQVRHLTDVHARQHADLHTAFFSYGENFGQSGCTIPDDGFPWRPTRQPICLGAWPVTSGPADGSFTTVMQWDSYPAREYLGIRYGMKSDSFEPYWTLPRANGPSFELAVGSPSAPRDKLQQHGWRLRDPLDVTRTPWTYQQYIQTSKAEFSVAKQGYAVTRSGWFSDRSAAYLASGRPVLVQDTGFGDWLKTHHGVLSFANFSEAVRGIDRIQSDYRAHCRAAREVAAQYFAASHVLTRLIDCSLSDFARC